ncbi:unnamed protein product [Medioppia subpectinata]|uniref:Glucose-methanol-choline oxidoreductase N-terminal domain-containing protein n=1 Tax=Medioppia subpectinata TaxID=1979941 RepID=A0A7R9KR16_9ACAR|nr:unnamed protein product [Medioppia subpectinata]CAG2107783.1 unnamed protein product [Medioppia subpectinata]
MLAWSPFDMEVIAHDNRASWLVSNGTHPYINGDGQRSTPDRNNQSHHSSTNGSIKTKNGHGKTDGNFTLTTLTTGATPTTAFRKTVKHREGMFANKCHIELLNDKGDTGGGGADVDETDSKTVLAGTGIGFTCKFSILSKYSPNRELLFAVAWITARRQVIHDTTCGRTQWESSYDFIVVGGGGAGAVVANKLSANASVRVLLLEAGGAQSAIYNDVPGLLTINNPIYNWIYFDQPVDGYGQQYAGGRVPEPIGKTLGGSTAHNSMFFVRGNRRGYDEWAHTYGARGWSYSDLLPVFTEWENNTDPRVVREAPDYHGVHGPIQISSTRNVDRFTTVITNTLHQLGYNKTDINGPNQAGYDLLQYYTNSSGLRTGTGNPFVDPNPHPDNLHIVCNALVTKVLFNELTAIGVEFTYNYISYTVYADREVIISGGAINSPQLLMLSGVGPAKHLKSLNIGLVLDLPVGDNYQNHPNVQMSAQLKQNYYHMGSELAQLDVHQLSQLYYDHTGPLWPPTRVLLYFSTRLNMNKQWPNVYFAISLTNITVHVGIQLNKINSHGSIRLREADPLLPPIINPAWLATPVDMENMVDAVKSAFHMLERSQLAHYIQPLPPFSAIGCPDCPDKQYLYECAEGLKCFITYKSGTSYHPSGSCRMGAVERPDVVVDPQLRVKGAKNLRICDASVFPVIPNGNTAAAAITVGYKCAQIIKDYYNLN